MSPKISTLQEAINMIEKAVNRPALFEIYNVESLAAFILGMTVTLDVKVAQELGVVLKRMESLMAEAMPEVSIFGWSKTFYIYSSGGVNSIKLFLTYFEKSVALGKEE